MQFVRIPRIGSDSQKWALRSSWTELLDCIRGRVGQELSERWLSREHAFSGADRAYSGKL